jgi:hypothetical protein
MKRLWLVKAAILLASVISAPAVAQQWHSMVFRDDARGVDENPLRGFVPYSSTKQTDDSFPHSLEWFYLPLADVVTGPDTYDWSAVERQLTAIAGRGHQAIFRFYLDYPKKPTGIPSYLPAAGLKTFRYSDAGNATSATPSVSPDYRDPRLIECLAHFIRAFGARYDGDARIGFLSAGLYGFWGEWQVHNHPLIGEPTGWSIRQKDKDALLRAYAETWSRTPIMVRYPDVTDDRKLLGHFGFHDDSFLEDTIGSEGWQFWQEMESAGTTGSWQWHPTGGEIYPALQSGLWESRPTRGAQGVKTAIATTHATWMLDSGLFQTALTPEEKTNALRAERMLGYKLFCRQWRITRSDDGSATLTVHVENRGVAPVYYAWPVEAEALDVNGKTVAQGNASWPLPTLLPGKSEDWSITLKALPGATKTLLLRITNPMPGGHPIAFANAEMSTVLPGWLTLNLD